MQYSSAPLSSPPINSGSTNAPGGNSKEPAVPVVTQACIEETKKLPYLSPIKKAHLKKDSVIAALKITLRCTKDCRFELKQGFACNILSLSEDMGMLNSIAHIIQKIPMLLDKEDEELQLKVMDQIPEFCDKIMKEKMGYQGIVEHVLPRIQNMIHFLSKKLSDKAVEVMLQIARSMNEEDRGKYILTYVLRLGHDEEDEDSRIVSVQLLSKLAEIFGRDLCEQFVVHEILSLSEDPSFKVRKAIAEHLVAICKVVTLATFSYKMLPLFCRLAGDTIWGVRKAAAEKIVEIAQLCSLEVREATLTPIVLLLLQDSSQWVNKAITQKMGEFIAVLIPSMIPTDLIDQYASMSQAKLPDEENLVYQCAYNFPAVLIACGRGLWGKLGTVYHDLWETDLDKVMWTLSTSIHEIVKIVQEDIARDDVVPLYIEYIQVAGAHVLPMLEHMDEILKVAEETHKSELLDILETVHEDSRRVWRIREKIASKISEYASYFSAEIIFKKLWRLLSLLLSDEISQVRISASEQVAPVFALCKESEDFSSLMLSDITSMCGESKYTTRIVYAKICEGFYNLPTIFESHLLGGFLGMLKDSVLGVRIAATKALCQIWRKNESLRKNAWMMSAIKELSGDSSRIVREEIAKIEERKTKIEEIKSSSSSEYIDEETAAAVNLDAIRKEIEEGKSSEEVKVSCTYKIDEID